NAAVIHGSFTQPKRLESLRTIGGQIYNALQDELKPGTGELTPASGLAAAEKFLGFLTEFAVRQGNVAFISELIPIEFNFLGGLREYGETLAKNLGLGRLSRRALQPLIQTLIADPLQWQLNTTYRPTLLNETSAIKA